MSIPLTGSYYSVSGIFCLSDLLEYVLQAHFSIIAGSLRIYAGFTSIDNLTRFFHSKWKQIHP